MFFQKDNDEQYLTSKAAARYLHGCAALFIVFVERLETCPAVYHAVDWVFTAKGHSLKSMKGDCYEIRNRLAAYL